MTHETDSRFAYIDAALAREGMRHAQQARALVANIAAAISTNEAQRQAGRQGAVYARIRAEAAERGINLPEWKP